MKRPSAGQYDGDTRRLRASPFAAPRARANQEERENTRGSLMTMAVNALSKGWPIYVAGDFNTELWDSLAREVRSQRFAAAWREPASQLGLPAPHDDDEGRREDGTWNPPGA